MKNLIVGLIAGLILGIIGTVLLYRPQAERAGREETPESSPRQSAVRAIKQPEGTLSEPLESGDRLPVRGVTGEAAFREASPPAAGQEESFATLTGEEAEVQPAIESGTIEELLDRWPDIYLSGNASRIHALLNELKAEGMKDIDRMITIFRGSDSLTNRLTAARTLGAMNRDLQDPELAGILKDEVFPFLKKTFRDEASRDIRTACLYTMGEVRTEKSRRFLEEMARDDDRRIARVAAYSLGIDGGEKAIETLSTFWKDAGERRLNWAGAAALGDNSDTRTMATVREIYSSSFNDNERIMAAYTLGRMNARLEDGECADLLVNNALPFLNDIMANSGDYNTRRRAAWALSETGLREADQSLLQVLVSTAPGDAELKSTARSALGSFGGNEAARECVNLLRYGDDTESLIRAGQVLAMMNNRRLESAPDELIRDEVIPLLKETWSEEVSDDMRREIVNGLGIAGGPEEIEFLNNISTDDRNLSRSIRRAIRRIEYREENGEDMAVSRMNRMRR